MKRALILLALVTLVVWLAQGAPAAGSAGPGREEAPPLRARDAAAASPSAAGAPAPQESCCLYEGETDPHWECISGSCYQVSGCGYSVDCSTCGCDPYAEWECVNDGGSWDPYSCTCTYSCDPDGSGEAYCWEIGGDWDPNTCTCYPPPCNPGEPVLVYSDYWYDYYCDGEYYVDCDNWCDYYEQYCQDGSLYDSWTACTSSCMQSWDYCGDGGGGDCWDWGDCWCDWDWGYCCEYDYCYDWWLM